MNEQTYRLTNEHELSRPLSGPKIKEYCSETITLGEIQKSHFVLLKELIVVTN